MQNESSTLNVNIETERDKIGMCFDLANSRISAAVQIVNSMRVQSPYQVTCLTAQHRSKAEQELYEAAMAYLKKQLS